MKNPKYSLEIDLNGMECERYSQFACYGVLTAEGDSLEDLLENAIVDIIDQDGGELALVPADSAWMQDKVAQAFYEDYYALTRAPGEDLQDYFGRAAYTTGVRYAG